MSIAIDRAPRALFRPETPAPPARPLGALRGFWALYQNPIRFWPEELYETGLMSTPLFGRKFVAMADPGMARALLLEDADAYVKSAVQDRVLKPVLGDSLLTTDGAVWRRQRRIAAPAFRPAAVAAYAPVMLAAGRAAGARLAQAGGETRDVMPELVRATLDVVADTLFLTEGWGAEARAQLAADIGVWLENMGRADPLDILGAPNWAPRPWKLAGRGAARRFRQAAEAIVARKRAEGARGDTLTDRLLRAADPEEEAGAGLTDAEVVDNVTTLVAAGHETTALALTWTLYLLARSPELQAALRAEAADCGLWAADPEDAAALAAAADAAALHDRVLREAMRLFPPAAATGRSVARETRLGPLSLAPGDHVTLVTYALHRRAAVWGADAAAFDPARFGPDRAPADRFAYLPFGDGPRVCIGARFAMLEATLLLAGVLRAAELAPPAGGGAREAVEPVLRVTLRPRGGMPLAARPARSG
ncbi:MAG: cytochrome P450 [Pseudomonadota bacterium]